MFDQLIESYQIRTILRPRFIHPSLSPSPVVCGSCSSRKMLSTTQPHPTRLVAIAITLACLAASLSSADAAVAVAGLGVRISAAQMVAGFDAAQFRTGCPPILQGSWQTVSSSDGATWTLDHNVCTGANGLATRATSVPVYSER